MKQVTVRFNGIRYNPEISGFQARATIHDSGVAYVYPVHVVVALTAEFDYVIKRLTRKARREHINRSSGLYMHHHLTKTARTKLPPQAA